MWVSSRWAAKSGPDRKSARTFNLRRSAKKAPTTKKTARRSSRSMNFRKNAGAPLGAAVSESGMLAEDFGSRA